MVKTLPANAGAAGVVRCIPESGRSCGGENGNPLKYSCGDNPMDREAWQAAVHGVTRTQTGLTTHAWTVVKKD